VRVIAATNKDLRLAIEDGTFRDDLFFRLNVIPVFVPPLRDRRKDIALLAEHFLGEFANEYGHRAKSLDDAALTVLKSHSWPGNVRELRNVLERLAIMASGETIAAADLEFLSGGGRGVGDGPTADAVPLQHARDEFERDYIVRALVAHKGNISRTAEALGVERSNLYRKMRTFGIMSPRRAYTESDASTGRVSSRAPGLP
jgi:two-component system nitrogen regulation response regulator NtrX